MFEPITEDNIQEFLDENGIDGDCVNTEDGRIYVSCPTATEDIGFGLDLRHPLFLEILSAATCKKLKPLPKFDFETYIMKNIGTSIASEMMRSVAQSLKTRTKENADKIIEVYKILESLK